MNFVYFKSYLCPEDNTKCEPIQLALEKGTYKIELWGARSGVDNYKSAPGKGAYVSGVISLIQKRNFFVYLGGVGSDWINNVAVGG